MLNKPISHITPFTLLDFPNHSACILWYAGCNMRCLYCYNPEIVLGKGKYNFQELFPFFEKRIGLLDGVVLSGGECLLHKNVALHIQQLKTMGFLVKIDTNGSNPDLLAQLIQENLIDYVALDFKSLAPTFQEITQSDLFANFERSFALLQAHTIPFELRTTHHSSLLSVEAINQMIQYLEKKNYRGNYYLQAFKNKTETLTDLPHSFPISADKLLLSSSFLVYFR